LTLLDKGLGPGWLLKLAADGSKLEQLKDLLAKADPQIRKKLEEELSEAVLDELLHFSRGLAADATAARFAFSLDAARLEEIYGLIGRGGLTEEVEEALLEFDRQVEDRRRRIRSRLEWRPARPQRRVDKSVSSRRYEPGDPGWFSGRLNDAPEMLGQKLAPDRAESIILALEISYYRYKDSLQAPTSFSPEISLRNTYFSQGLEPRVQFGRVGDFPGVEGYLLEQPEGGLRVLEFPLEDGTFNYLMFDGHHRAAALILQGQRTFEQVTVMHLNEVHEKFGLSEQDILDAIRDLHTHLYMTDEPVPKEAEE